MRSIAKRLLTVIPTLIGVVIVTFLLTRVLPGDAAAYFAGPAATAETIEQVRQAMGFDQPIWTQFVTYVTDLVHGDLGMAFSTGQPVIDEITGRLPASAELTLLALIFAIVVAVPLGIVAAVKQGSIIDHLCRIITTAGVSLPVFFTGLLFLYLFYFVLGWAPPPVGRIDFFVLPPDHITGFYLIDSLLTGNMEAFAASWAQIWLPAVTLGLFALAPIARITRASMIAALSSEFVRTAKAAGLSPRRTIVTYAFRNAMLPVITTLGMVFSFLLGANVLVEKVFAWPGIGSFAVDALVSSDYAPIQGFVLTMAILYVLLNLIIDLLYGVIDPRVRIDG